MAWSDYGWYYDEQWTCVSSGGFNSSCNTDFVCAGLEEQQDDDTWVFDPDLNGYGPNQLELVFNAIQESSYRHPDCPSAARPPQCKCYVCISFGYSTAFDRMAHVRR